MSGCIVYCHGKAPKQRTHGFQTSRVACVLRPYDFCSECVHRSFVAIIPLLTRTVECPVSKLAAEARGTDLIFRLRESSPLMAADVRTALQNHLDGCRVELQVCRVARPFYHCVSCRGKQHDSR